MNNTKVRIEGCGIRVTSLLRRFVEERSRGLFAKNPQLLHVEIETNDASKGGSGPCVQVRGIACLPALELEASNTATTAYLAIGSMLDKLDERLRQARLSSGFSGNRIGSKAQAGSRSRERFSRPAFSNAT